MAGSLEKEGPARYRSLLRRLASGSEAVDPDALAPVLRSLGRSADELARDLEAMRRRRALAAEVDSLLDLEERHAIVSEGYRWVQEAARRARAEATARERKARTAFRRIERERERARAAEAELKRLLPAEVVTAWERAEAQVRRLREDLRAARWKGVNTEHLEAALEQADAAYERTRREALGLA